MKSLFTIVLLCFISATHAFATPVADTSITHLQDGKLDEWDKSRFYMDDDTKISYAIDNDGQFLYIGLQIPELSTQMKLMRTGMTVYIDLKGKRKTGRGIEFPVTPDKGDGVPAMEAGSRQSRNEDEIRDPAKRNATMIMMRNGMAVKQLNTLRLTGFGDGDASQQILNAPGSVQVAYKCDTSETMEIEYRIPLSLLDGNAKLNGKQISIGCKIHAMEMRAGGGFNGGNGGMGGMGGGGMRAGAAGRMGGSGRGMGMGGMGSGMSRETMMREQSFWAKYTFTGL
ncbi:MAG: hypothetical protein DI535_13100 [Citrobacter freundii]|nr:MAG: hypothetical protein DI535_13100 [Citrobacter freundii]